MERLPESTRLTGMRLTAMRAASTFACSLLLALAACGGDKEPSTGAEPPKREGDAAVWRVADRSSITPSSDTIEVLVERVGCNSGVTGEVFEPDVEYGTDTVAITFEVEPINENATCPGNNQVPYTVSLAEPLGERMLMDGQCLDGGEATSTSHCLP